jgi:hypothetical protein
MNPQIYEIKLFFDQVKIIVLNLNILFIKNFQILLIRNKILWSYSSKNSFKFVYRITHNNMVIKRPPPPKRSSQSSEIRTSHNDTRTHSEARSSHSDRSSHSSESNMRTSVSSDRRISLRNKILWSYKETKCIKKVLIN